MTFAKEAWPFVLPFWVIAAALAALRQPWWALALAFVGFLVLLFFRDPTRRFDGPAGTVIAPADGVVTRIDVVEDADLGPGKFHRVVTFLSALDVHVQRAPADGEVIAARYTSGRKVAAFRPDADQVNEKHLSVLRLPNGDTIGVCQIAGLIARRVVCYLRLGDRVTRGQLIGLIKFGSRVDLMVPESYQVLVAKGQRLRNGETPVALAPAAPPAG